jgi:S-adenosylmethionine synthetase
MFKCSGEVTAESVRRGHPDKFCDQIADAILDECLRMDRNARVAVEVMASGNLVIVGGEITTDGWVDFRFLVERVAADIGYSQDFSVINIVQQQSPDIDMGVSTGGAGDQGIMVGYAVDHNSQYMPMPIMLSHQLMMDVDSARCVGIYPDGKCQFTLDSGVEPERVLNVLVSLQHDECMSRREVEDFVAPIVGELIASNSLSWSGDLLVNPTGRFVIGGPLGDTGVTGRKTQVDSYGPWVAHGGGAFSGKDPTKVDRSAAYAARHLAKNVVALSDRVSECTVYVAYGIGLAQPLSLQVYDQDGKQCAEGHEIAEALYGAPPFLPGKIIERLGLLRPIYGDSSKYGHFGWPRSGSDIMFSWESVEDGL